MFDGVRFGLIRFDEDWIVLIMYGLARFGGFRSLLSLPRDESVWNYNFEG